jgi:beta-glucosidase
VTFSPGFALSGEEDQALLTEATTAARAADVAIVFLGLPGGSESEGFDREHIDLPGVQLRLLQAVAQVNRNVVVVLANGGVVRVATWEGHARAILEGWLNGQAGGGAIADLLFGRANPCGRLAETIPLRLQDTPAYLNFPGDGAAVSYGERLYVGYRYYDARDMPVSYPFGHGLSYTTFRYSGLQATVEGEGEEAVVRLQLTVTNTGPVTGKDVVQSTSAMSPPAWTARSGSSRHSPRSSSRRGSPPASTSSCAPGTCRTSAPSTAAGSSRAATSRSAPAARRVTCR